MERTQVCIVSFPGRVNQDWCPSLVPVWQSHQLCPLMALLCLPPCDSLCRGLHSLPSSSDKLVSAPLPNRDKEFPFQGCHVWVAQMPWALIQFSVPLNFFQAHLLFLQSQWPFKSQGLALSPHRLSGSVSLLCCSVTSFLCVPGYSIHGHSTPENTSWGFQHSLGQWLLPAEGLSICFLWTLGPFLLRTTLSQLHALQLCLGLQS